MGLLTPRLIALFCIFPAVAAAAPGLVASAPNFISMGDSNFTFDVYGSGFVNGSITYWESTALTTTFVSSEKLTALPPAGLAGFARGQYHMTVRNPDGSVSPAIVVGINPVIASISPSAIPVGTGSNTFTISGRGFLPTDYVSFNCGGYVYRYDAVFLTSSQLQFTMNGCGVRNGGYYELWTRDSASYASSNIVSLTVSNTPLAVSLFSPASAVAGGPGFALTIFGSGFLAGSTAQWNGTPLATTYASASQLTATIPASLVAAAGTAQVTVSNPGTSPSLPRSFVVLAPAPTLAGVNPSQMDAGSAAVVVAVSGANFAPGAIVTWGGTPLSTAFSSSTLLTASVPPALTATSGKFTISVKNVDGSVSAGSMVAVQPVLTSIMPSSATAGAASVSITATGAGFTATDAIRAVMSGVSLGLPTAFVNSTTLAAQLPSSVLAASSTVSISVVDATAGLASRPQSFAIRPALPTISSISPSTVAAGAADFTLTVTGSNFIPGSAIQWNGAALPTTFVDSTRLTTRIAAAQLLTSGSTTVTVTNPDRSVSNVMSFAIGPALPAATSAGVVNAASSLPALAPGALISIYGANLAAATASANAVPLPLTLAETGVSLDGKAIPVLFVSPGQINAQIPYETRPGMVKLAVQSRGLTGGGVEIRVSDIAPGILTILPTTHALLWNIADGRVNSADTPAKPGQYVTAYLTGQGAVDPAVATGDAAPVGPFSTPLAQVEVKIGGVPAQVQFAGLAPGFVGLLQLNLKLPDVAAGEQTIEVTIGGVAANAAIISVGTP